MVEIDFQNGAGKPLDATQKTPFTPCFKLYFTSASASWMNLVERFFAEITKTCIRRGSYSSVDNLEAAIYDDLAHQNERPKPF